MFNLRSPQSSSLKTLKKEERLLKNYPTLKSRQDYFADDFDYFHEALFPEPIKVFNELIADDKVFIGMSKVKSLNNLVYSTKILSRNEFEAFIKMKSLFPYKKNTLKRKSKVKSKDINKFFKAEYSDKLKYSDYTWYPTANLFIDRFSKDEVNFRFIWEYLNNIALFLEVLINSTSEVFVKKVTELLKENKEYVNIETIYLLTKVMLDRFEDKEYLNEFFNSPGEWILEVYGTEINNLTPME